MKIEHSKRKVTLKIKARVSRKYFQVRQSTGRVG